MLALGLRRTPLGLDALLGGGLAPLARVAQPLRREGDVALEPSHFELGVAQAALDLGAPSFGGVPRLNPREFELADYHRRFILTEDLDAERITAVLRDGVLRVEIPKSPRVQPKKIPVRTE